MELGARIRALRKARQLSLKNLAKVSGVALATLSRIENGKAGGNFKTHQRIAEAFGIPISELYKDLETPEPEVAVTEPAAEEPETFTYDEKAQALLLTSQVSSKQMFPQLLILQPGGKTALEQYRPGTERWLFGLAGTAEVMVGEKTHRVTPGGTLYFKADRPHQCRNADRAVVKLISVTTPTAL